MLGIGAGARSYTKSVHYCTENAVGKSGINEIIADYSMRRKEEHSSAVYGGHLSIEEQKRRYLLKSILRAEGLSFSDYRRNFESDVFDDFPDLEELLDYQLALVSDDNLRITDLGFERSDTIGPWLFSAEVVSKMDSFEFI